MERITVEIVWEAPDGELDDLENEGGDGTLIDAAKAAYDRGVTLWVNSTREEA